MTQGTDENAMPATQVAAIVSQLRETAKGRYVWRVQDKDNYSYCIEFTDSEKPEAEAWWNENRKKNPEFHANHELARVHLRTSAEWLMLKAANMLERMSGFGGGDVVFGRNNVPVPWISNPTLTVNDES